jgi:chromosome segregation ATPase
VRFALLLALFAIFLTSGCQSGDAAKSATGQPIADADEPATLYEQVRSGAYQLSQAEDAIAEAYQESLKLPKTVGEERLDIQEVLDGTGENLSKYAGEPPPKEEFEKDLAKETKRRQEAIDAANDTIRDLQEAKYIITALADANKGKEREELEKLDALVDVAIEGLQSAIEAYGGKVEAEPEEQPIDPGK